MPDSSPSLPLQITVKAILNVLLVWLLATYLPQYFALQGGTRAVITVGALLTLLNIFLRPVLDILTLPLKLFATILAIVIVNGIFVELIHRITLRMDPEIVRLSIEGGLIGWVVVALLLGLGNWLVKEMMHKSA